MGRVLKGPREKKPMCIQYHPILQGCKQYEAMGDKLRADIAMLVNRTAQLEEMAQKIADNPQGIFDIF